MSWPFERIEVSIEEGGGSDTQPKQNWASQVESCVEVCRARVELDQVGVDM